MHGEHLKVVKWPGLHEEGMMCMHTHHYPTAYKTKMGSPCLCSIAHSTREEENCVSVLATAVTQKWLAGKEFNWNATWMQHVSQCHWEGECCQNTCSPCSSSSCLMQHSTVTSTIWHIPFPHNPLVTPLQKELIWSLLAVGRRVGEVGKKSCSFLSASPQVFKKGKLHHYLHCSPVFKRNKKRTKQNNLFLKNCRSQTE